MAINLTMTQFADVMVTPKDRKGNKADVQNPSITGSDPAVINVMPHPDDPSNPLRARVESVGQGSANVAFSADSDLGEGVVELLGTEAVTVISGTAVAVSIESTVSEEPDA